MAVLTGEFEQRKKQEDQRLALIHICQEMLFGFFFFLYMHPPVLFPNSNDISLFFAS